MIICMDIYILLYILGSIWLIIPSYFAAFEGNLDIDLDIKSIISRYFTLPIEGKCAKKMFEGRLNRQFPWPSA